MTAGSTGPDARIDELEMRLAHQDQALQELGDELYRQQRQVAQLETAVRQLAERLVPGEGEPATGTPADEVPPHY